MKVYIERTDEWKEVNAINVQEIFQKLKINPTTVIVTRNNELITENTKINDNDEVKLISVISGG
ncbi:MoaD/ThiS family protein [Candidatus Woesearchaeota archaeon]|nr:MoaD/ThiS family protein [Candidatus Woesearchaeota archaeon]